MNFLLSSIIKLLTKHFRAYLNRGSFYAFHNEIAELEFKLFWNSFCKASFAAKPSHLVPNRLIWYWTISTWLRAKNSVRATDGCLNALKSQKKFSFLPKQNKLKTGQSIGWILTFAALNYHYWKLLKSHKKWFFFPNKNKFKTGQ